MTKCFVDPVAWIILSMVALALMAFTPAPADTTPKDKAAASGKAPPQAPSGLPKIVALDPPEQDFFSRALDFHGVPIKAGQVVSDAAMYAAYDRLSQQLKYLPQVTANLAAAGADLEIIGKDQVTSDLPEFRHLKGKPLEEYHGLTIDQRTRGMGGRHTSCGEENLLKLKADRYYGRDICLHEFAHCIRNFGVPPEVNARFDQQYRRALDKGLWVKSYAGSNPDEFFAEMTMWYFGTHGDLNMTGVKPENGPEGLKKYDPETFALMNDFYSGRIPIRRLDPAPRRPA